MFLDNLKSYFIIIIFLAVLGVGGYWAVMSLQVDADEFEKRNNDVRPVVVNEPTGYNPNIQTVPTPSTSNITKPVNVTTDASLFSNLKSELQKLINDNVLMKKGSRGTRVGVVQEFLNIYNGTDSKADNDFGATTESQVKAFQKAEGLIADGQTGSGTYKKMIEWLDKQN